MAQLLAQLIEALRQWMAANRPLCYAIVAGLLAAYLMYRPPPPPDRRDGGCRTPSRQPSSTRPKISISAMGGVLLDGEASGGLRVVAKAVEAVRKLAEYGDVYLIAGNVTSDAAEKAVRDTLQREGVLALPGIDARKLLVCSSSIGRTAMCRQIEPELHVDEALDVVESLAPHVPCVGHVGPSAAPSKRDNVHVASDLGELVDVFLATRSELVS